jgi:NAD(P)-dependent dehydrogenase (short-subunit alcohol dehydrogenase family)
MKITGSVTCDPREYGPKPPFTAQLPLKPPGSSELMSPKPDHGEASYEGSGLLRDLVAVITGADSGIGRAVAVAFAREGAHVVISYLNEGPDAEETERLVREAGRRALRLPGDLADEAHCQSVINRTIAEFSQLDVLVNNAAYQSTNEKPDEITSAEFDRAFKTNVYATFHLSQAALKEMKPGGVIINTTSIQSFDPSGMLLPYAATKSAISSMTRTMAELAIKQGVRVNGVAPGPVWTPLIPSTMPPKAYQSFGASSVFKRPAQPAEMAPIYVFLASRYASYVTGEIYGATGGQMPL